MTVDANGRRITALTASGAMYAPAAVSRLAVDELIGMTEWIRASVEITELLSEARFELLMVQVCRFVDGSDDAMVESDVHVAAARRLRREAFDLMWPPIPGALSVVAPVEDEANEARWNALLDRVAEIEREEASKSVPRQWRKVHRRAHAQARKPL